MPKHDIEDHLTIDDLLWAINFTRYINGGPIPTMPHPGTRIIDYTDAELDEAIADTKREIGEDAFYTILKGIDAYFEKRRRKYPQDPSSTSHRPGGKL